MLCRNLRQVVKKLCSEIQFGCTLPIYVEAFSWCTGGCAGRLEPGFLRRCCQEVCCARAGSRAAGRRSPKGPLRGCQSGGSAVPGATESDFTNGGEGIQREGTAAGDASGSRRVPCQCRAAG